MKRNLSITCLFCHTVIVSLLFVTYFVTRPAFFQHLIAAKQWEMESVMQIAIIVLVLNIPSVKKIKFTFSDEGILILSLWWILNKKLSIISFPHFNKLFLSIAVVSCLIKKCYNIFNIEEHHRV
jgi:hypothetical protein